jgi:hypothetical protein
MLGVYQHIDFCNSTKKFKFKAGDNNKSVIMMWEKAQTGWNPPTTVTEDEYNQLKNEKDSSAEKGYVGHQYGFGGKYFKGYAPKYGKTVDSSSASSKVVKIAKKLKLNSVSFSHGLYT